MHTYIHIEYHIIQPSYHIKHPRCHTLNHFAHTQIFMGPWILEDCCHSSIAASRTPVSEDKTWQRNANPNRKGLKPLRSPKCSPYLDGIWFASAMGPVIWCLQALIIGAALKVHGFLETLETSGSIQEWNLSSGLLRIENSYSYS